MVKKKSQGVKRNAFVDVPEGRRKLVGERCASIRADKDYFDKVFKRMREDMEYARLGAKKRWVDNDNYTVPIINRYINEAVASLYAKNPKSQAKRKPKLMYTVWDGTQDSLKAAFSLMQSGQDADGSATQIVQEAQQARSYDQMMERMGKTLEILFEYFTGEDYPDFKKRMKSCVRRAKTTGVGYTEIAYHRAMEADPDVTRRMGDMTQELELIKSRQSDLADGVYGEDDTRAVELKEMLVTLEQEKFKVIEEGLVFDFPRSMDIIPHKACTQLEGFIGCDYVTREYLMTPEEVQSTFKVDIGDRYTPYMQSSASKNDPDTTGGDQEGDRPNDTEENQTSFSGSKKTRNIKGKACIWRVMDKKTRQILWLCDGYPDYLREPAPPEIQVPGFWTVFVLTFNSVEDEAQVFPPSDVHYLKHPQREFNNARQGVREHRRANRPKYFVKAGALEDAEKDNLEDAPAHAVIELSGLETNVTIDQLIQPYKGVPIDPNLYETSSIMKDVLYGVGAQSADLGQTGDSTATESSIAEHSRQSTLSSNVDELDEYLSEIARGSAQAMLQQMSIESVKEIVGPGAVWPQLNGEQIAKELFLSIKAGSSGRPNQAQDLANLERGMQYMIQLGGINPAVLAKKYANLLDLDEDELIVEGMPSIVSMNAMQAAQAKQQAGPPGAPQGAPGQPTVHNGPPSTNPATQGGAGGQNMQQPQGVTPQGQPAYPAPQTHVQGSPTVQ